MTSLYRMTALVFYSNGNIGWPAGMSANWPAGEERLMPQNVYEQIMRDGAGQFDVKYQREPQPAPTLAVPAVVDTPEPAPPAAVEAVEPEAPIDTETAAAVEGEAPRKPGTRPRR